MPYKWIALGLQGGFIGWASDSKGNNIGSYDKKILISDI